MNHTLDKSFELNEALLKDEQVKLKSSLTEAYGSKYGALYAPFDAKMLDEVKAVAQEVRQQKPTLFLLVGIGGSSMGSMAVLQALFGTFLNETSNIKFYCADTIDESYTGSLLKLVETELMLGGSVFLCIITKSGTTTETLMNGALFLDLLKEYRPQTYQDSLLIITQEGSPLEEKARAEGYRVILFASTVGGRFSVFSPVGLFPLAVLGVDVDQFCLGAQKAHSDSMSEQPHSWNAFTSALMLYKNYQEGYIIHNFFAFTPDLFMLGNWHKQLIGESLGKKSGFSKNDNAIGITPLVSIGTVDLHSVVQLFLAGPANTFTSFVAFSNEGSEIRVPKNMMSDLLEGVEGLSFTHVKEATFKGTVAAYKQQKRPFTTIELKRTSFSIGYFMMTKMVETIFFARLANINPFDQPEVELYKKATREFLAHSD